MVHYHEIIPGQSQIQTGVGMASEFSFRVDRGSFRIGYDDQFFTDRSVSTVGVRFQNTRDDIVYKNYSDRNRFLKRLVVKAGVYQNEQSLHVICYNGSGQIFFEAVTPGFNDSDALITWDMRYSVKVQESIPLIVSMLFYIQTDYDGIATIIQGSHQFTMEDVITQYDKFEFNILTSSPTSQFFEHVEEFESHLNDYNEVLSEIDRLESIADGLSDDIAALQQRDAAEFIAR